MLPHRLHRLTLLTQGVALLGLGAATGACNKESPPTDTTLHINAPYVPTPSDSAATAPPPSASAVVAADDARAPVAASASAPVGQPRPPIHTNAPRARPRGGDDSK